MIRAELRSVSKTYGRGEAAQKALSSVDFALAEGEFVMLLGASGSGKTTLLNILGLLDRPDEGDVTLDGEPTGEWSDRRRADKRNRSLGFVFQTGDLVPVLSAEQNVRLPLDIAGIGARPGSVRARAALERVGLAAFHDRLPGKLSGGQCQRVAIARALVNDPSIVVADEPTASLDTDNARNIAQVFRKLRDERGVSILVATHDARLTEYATRVVRLVDGRIVEDRPR